MGTYQEYAMRLELAQAKEDVRETLVCAEKMLESAGQEHLFLFFIFLI